MSVFRLVFILDIRFAGCMFCTVLLPVLFLTMPVFRISLLFKHFARSLILRDGPVTLMTPVYCSRKMEVKKFFLAIMKCRGGKS